MSRFLHLLVVLSILLGCSTINPQVKELSQKMNRSTAVEIIKSAMSKTSSSPGLYHINPNPKYGLHISGKPKFETLKVNEEGFTLDYDFGLLQPVPIMFKFANVSFAYAQHGLRDSTVQVYVNNVRMPDGTTQYLEIAMVSVSKDNLDNFMAALYVLCPGLAN